MTITTVSDLYNPEILTETVQGAFAQKNAFMGSALVALGACVVSDSMPESGPRAIGKQITVPYFGTIGAFVNNPDGSAVTPNKLSQTSEVAAVTRDSLAFEISQWAIGNAAVNPNVGDPYEEAAGQIVTAASRAMDSRIMTAASAAGGLLKDVYSSTVPVTINWDLIVDSKTAFGDEQEGIVAMAVHSQVQKDMMKLKDSTGRPLLIQSETQGGPVERFCGVPVVVSDRLPLTGSTMGAVTSSGTSPPTVTLAGTPNGAHNLQIDVVTGGAAGTATFRFSVDGGSTWSATYLIPNGGGAVVLADDGSQTDINSAKTIDSLVGANGITGITATFASGTYNADNLYTSTAQLKVTSLLMKQGAMAYWFNRLALTLKDQPNVTADTNISAMHLYSAAIRYRRARGGSKPGVVKILHNVTNY